MPSYRVVMALGLMHAGADPADVLPAASAAAREHTAVEAADIGIVRGAPRVTVRFEAGDDASAAGVARAVVDRTEELVEVEVARVTRRWGSRWSPLGR
ncbi:hypothetical protein OEB99_00160 [Actinotalea sp. M2MS4P-6]|uniref:hypothetical protein n=1 Tax=Actinotalea sp. M2MS4P-6 TaxID=2983762 RepID=UPI0021E45672|nr:hypothetical protein [Actinotalea sp. M2MS4P-6]MCV2392710.1 hypothetical protein [Actinotalea sp. M2MS4P-6]